MDIKEILCRRENFGGLRASKVKYIVVHFTAGKNDTAENNGRYFARVQKGTSAHYYVDEREVVRSVPDDYVAWHCGGYHYYHDKCRNANSIGVEICTKWDGQNYSFAPEAVALAQELVRMLMEKYNVPEDHVVRHWDVTHKVCPAPFVGEGQAAWEEFKGGLIMYNKIENVPDWAKPTIQKLIDRDSIEGDGQGNLGLDRSTIKTLVILDKDGVLDK